MAAISTKSGNSKKRQLSLFECVLAKKNKTQYTPGEPLPVILQNSVTISDSVACDPSPPSTLSATVEPAVLAVEFSRNIDPYIKQSTLTSQEKFNVLSCLWYPDDDFQYKKSKFGNQQRSFQGSWLKAYKWLCYSKLSDAAFCKVCVVFSRECVGKGSHQSKGALATCGFRNWKCARETFRDHQNLNYHIEAAYFSEQFELVFTQKRDSINQTVHSWDDTEREGNRAIMFSLIQTIILCGRQNIALRGHDDQGSVSTESPNFNDGNFRALLRFRVESGDEKLAHHLKSAPSNAMYTSAPIQNKLINICGGVILKTIVDRINRSKCFSILADETTDISTVEQLTICARYVHEENGTVVVREDFLMFVPVTDLTGAGLAEAILTNLDMLGIDLDFLRGQSYDGASAMSSKLKGVQARVLQKYPMALYTYCASHCLNLVITDACSIQPIRNMIGVIKEVYNFFSRSALRTAALEKYIKESSEITGSEKIKRLTKLCDTRWVERHDAIIRFAQLYGVTLQALKSIGVTANDPDTRAKAFCLQKSMQSFDIIVSLRCAILLLSLSLPLSRALQAKDADLQACYEQVMEITAVIRRIRADCVEEFHKIYEKSKRIAEKLDVLVTVPRTCSRQINRANYTTKEPETYYRVAIFVPFVDEFLNSLTTRFEDHASNLCSLLNILPRYIKDTKSEDFETLYNFYRCDLNCDFQEFEGEYRIWKNKWANTSPEQFPNSVIETLGECNPNFYPNIYELLKLLCTLPVTTATAERSFSSLKRLKTYLRNTMSESRLNGLTLLHVYHDVQVPVTEVIQEFKKLNPKIPL